ncbi:MAG TPA: NlpC/P60 family protein [Anaeromyxobacteraceae bacterium]|nr:NlpC/P60 family protein [Anaeromyxobacteraceae bacterium]
MTAPRAGLAVALALVAQGCATTPGWTRHHALPPPAQENRAGALARSTGPDSGSVQVAGPVSPAAPSGREAKAATSTATATPATRAATSIPSSTAPEVAAAVKAVSSLVGQRQIVLDGVDYGPDCAALARAAFARAGRPLPASARDATALHALAASRGALLPTRTPSPGDLVFISDRPGGPPVHVGLVSRSEPDGTAVVLHRVARGVRPVRVNLAYPSRSDDPATGKHINDALRVGTRALPAGSLVVSVSDLLRRR